MTAIALEDLIFFQSCLLLLSSCLEFGKSGLKGTIEAQEFNAWSDNISNEGGFYHGLLAACHHHVDSLFKVDPADYMPSFCGNDALREHYSVGKNRSFLYLTGDPKYMIKTMKKAEAQIAKDLVS